MRVVEISIRADAEGAEALATTLNEHAYGGAVIEQVVTPEEGEKLDPAYPYTVRAFLLEDDTLEEKRRIIEEAVWRFGLLRPFGEYQTRTLAEEDYANAWRKFYSILHVGQRVVIKPTWLDYAPQADEVVIELDPGMAFGTGLHPTTRLCLEELEALVTPGCTLLDVGTGSGILALAAVKLGAGHVDAYDTDPLAVEAATKNVEQHNLAEKVRVIAGTIELEPTPTRYDLITANIFADTIVTLSGALAQHLKPDGRLITSGILVEHAEEVRTALEAVGLPNVKQKQEEDWVVLTASR